MSHMSQSSRKDATRKAIEEQFSSGETAAERPTSRELASGKNRHHVGSRRQRKAAAPPRWRKRLLERQRIRRHQRHCRIEPLETRQMLAVNVIEPLGQLDTFEDGHDAIVDLRDVFQSDTDQTLEYRVVRNSDPDLVDASIEEWGLRLRHLPERSGAAEITVRAIGQQDGEEVVDTLALNVAPVNDWPTYSGELPEITIAEGDHAVVDLTAYFSDLEQTSDSLTYSAAPFDVSYPGNPIGTATIEAGQLTLQTTNHGFGYAQYAVRAEDDQGAQVATTLYVYVDPVNDAPTAAQLPDRHHSVPQYSEAPLIAIDLWRPNPPSGVVEYQFWDVEDEQFLEYSVTSDSTQVFDLQPYVDENDFLLYRPTAQAGFEGSAVITITAKDREGLEARLPDGSRSQFTVHVNNPETISAAGSTSSTTPTETGDSCAPICDLGESTSNASQPAAAATLNQDPQTPSTTPAAGSDADWAHELSLSAPSDVGSDIPVSATDPGAQADAGVQFADFVWPGLPQFPGAFPPPNMIGPTFPGPGIPGIEYPPPEGPYPGEPSDPTNPYPNPLDPQPPLLPEPLPDPFPEPDLPLDPIPTAPPSDEPPPSDVPPSDVPPSDVPPSNPADPPPYPDDPYPDDPYPDDPPPDAPPAGDPPTLPDIMFDLDALRRRIPDNLEQSPGALVALNNDYDEWNLATETISVGPFGRTVTVLRRLKDNQPDRFPTTNRQHHLASLWSNTGMFGDVHDGWETGDKEVRPAVVTSNVAGTVSFDVPDNAMLWVPAWALYGSEALFEHSWQWNSPVRWLPVRESEEYLLNNTWFGMASLASQAIPVAIEGMEEGAGEIVATFTPDDGRNAVDDAVTIHVVAVDIDIDSDNSNGLDVPDRSTTEEQLEDTYKVTGKRIRINSDDVDRDGIPDFVDGFDLDGLPDWELTSDADDDQVSGSDQLGFVPIVIDLPAPIDPERALLRFVYSDSDPANASLSADGARQVELGGLRLWTVDETYPRNPHTANDQDNPGHFVASQEVTGPSRHYSVAQLTGGNVANQFTLYVEGIAAGKYGLAIQVDPDGIPPLVDDGNGNRVSAYPNLFEGFVMHDSIQVMVESEVTVSAVNAIAAETGGSQTADLGEFLVTRDWADTKQGLMVYYRVVDDAQQANATDLPSDPSRNDYTVVDTSGERVGLAEDPVTSIGSIYLPPGTAGATLAIVPHDDSTVEWDESISIDLIPWGEYRSLHDQPNTITPNDGLPSSYNAWAWWNARSPYRLKTDDQGEPVEHFATITLLDDDQIENHSYQQADRESTELVAESIRYGALQVDVHGGQARYELPVLTPQYREDDNLRPIAETIIRLPEDVAGATSLRGTFTVGGQSGETLSFDLTDLASYLEPNANRELRLVIPGPDSLVTSLATGHYDHDIQLLAEIDGKTLSRTLRGTTDVINRIDPALGTPEWGQRWTLDEMDRLFPADGSFTGGTGTSVSRLTPIGAAAESGIALVRGDNSVTWFRAGEPTKSRLIEIARPNDTAVQFSQPHQWTGHRNADYHAYRTTFAGLADQAEEVTWTFESVVPGKMVQVYVEWAPGPTLATNAAYKVSADPVTGRADPILVDQRYAPGEFTWEGRTWRSLGFFAIPADHDSLQVTLTTRVDDSTYADGAVSAGAVMLVEAGPLVASDDAFSTLTWPKEAVPLELITKTQDVYQFDPQTGVLNEMRDRNGNRTRYDYVDTDSDGRQDELSRIERQSGLTTTIDYADQYVSSITDFAGRTTQWNTLDGVVTQVVLPDPGFGMQVPSYDFEYDLDNELLVEVTDPRGNLTSIARNDETGRVAMVTNPDGNQWQLLSYLETGLDGQLHSPATGVVPGADGTAVQLAQPWAQFVDTRAAVWQYQTDPHALMTARAEPPVPSSNSYDVWRWERNATGLPNRLISPPGGGGDTPLPAIVTQQQFDSLGNLERRVYADGTFEQWTYDDLYSQVITYQDRLGRGVSFQLNQRGNVAIRTEHEQKYADTPDRQTAFVYTQRPLAMEDMPGGMIVMEVIAAGTTDAVTTMTQYHEEGPAIGLPATVRQAFGNTDPDIASTVQFHYDEQRRLAEKIDPAGHSTNFVYDALDRLYQQVDTAPGTDDHGRPVTTYSYDAMGNVTSVTNPRGVTTIQQYDSMNRLSASSLPPAGGFAGTDQRPATTRYTHDGEGNLVAERDAADHTTIFAFDARNQRVAITQPVPEIAYSPGAPDVIPAVPVTTYSYDAWGNLRSSRDPLGAVVSYQYDLFRQNTRMSEPAPGTLQHEAPVTHFIYDAAGQLLESREGVGGQWQVIRYEYDDLGRVRHLQQPADANGRHPETVFSYDLRDNLVGKLEPGNRLTSFRYDDRDRLIESALPDPDDAGPLGAPTTRLEYNVDGSLRSSFVFDALRPETFVSTRFQYDALGRMVHEVMSDPDGTGPLVAPESFYDYDIMGNQIRRSEVIGPGKIVVHNQFFDNWDRLWKKTQVDGGHVVDESIEVFDLVGNVVQRNERMAEGPTPIYRQTDFVIDALGRLITQIAPAPLAGEPRPVTHFVYDAVGNLRFERDTAGVQTEYQFDALGRKVAMIETATEDHASPVTRMEYTTDGQLAALVDPIGRRTEYEYDALGQLRIERLLPSDGTSTGPLAEVRHAYDLSGNRVSTFDADGNATLVAYDKLDRPIMTTDNGATTTRRYDGMGRLVSETDPLGATTRYGYDRLGRRTITSPPHLDGQELDNRTSDDDQADLTGTWLTRSEGWNGAHRFAETVGDAQPSANWVFSELQPGTTYEVLATWWPDAANVTNALFHVEADGAELSPPVIVDQQQIAADIVDASQTWQRLAVVTVPGNSMNIELTAPEAVGNLVADAIWIVEVAGNTYTGYDTRGNVIAESDALGNTKRYTFNHRSQRTSGTDANGDTTQFAYDMLGRLQSVTDPLGNVTSYAYNSSDRVVEERVTIDGEPATTRYEYDVAGNLLQTTDRLERVRTMQYDALGRLQDEMWYASAADAQADHQRLNTIERTYDAAGRLVATRDSTSSYEYQWDELDRPLETTIDLVAAPPVTLRNDYTRHDGLRDALHVEVNGHEDHVTEYTYDARSRLSRIEQSGDHAASKRVDFGYSEANQLADIRRYMGLGTSELVVQSQFHFDRQGQLAELTHRNGDNVLAEYAWVYDAAHRVVQQDASADGITRFHYDARGQLVAVDDDNQDDLAFAYDANGNRSENGYVVGQRNMIESDDRYRYEYDAQGNRSLRVEIATGKATRYEWNLRNQLVRIVELDHVDGTVLRSVEYTYDVLGQRTGKTITPQVGPAEVENFVYDDQNIVLRFAAGNLANRYLHGPLVDQVLADEQVDGLGDTEQLLWPLTDRLGTVRDLAQYDDVSDVTTIANHITYDAFGQITGESATAVEHIFGFTGRETDAESDLYFYRARYYDPQIGQFISDDPAGFAAGDANLRRYVGNDPANRTDPTGLYDQDVHFYFNYYLARYLGLDQPSGWVRSKTIPVSEAYIIAYFATRVDYDSGTAPISGGASARRRFHMPDPNDEYGVREDEPRVRKALLSVANVGDAEMFGLLLHAYQDSFAHREFGDKMGHAVRVNMTGIEWVGSDPDEPFRHSVRERRMAQKTYDAMYQLVVARRGGKAKCSDLSTKSFNEFWKHVESVMLQPPRGTKHEAALQRRIASWRVLIAKDYRGASPKFDDTAGGSRSRLARRLRDLSKRVPEWYGSGYSHAKYWKNWQPVPPLRSQSTAAPPQQVKRIPYRLHGPGWPLGEPKF